MKRVGDGETHWHADLAMAPLDTNALVTCLPTRTLTLTLTLTLTTFLTLTLTLTLALTLSRSPAGSLCSRCQPRRAEQRRATGVSDDG